MQIFGSVVACDLARTPASTSLLYYIDRKFYLSPVIFYVRLYETLYCCRAGGRMGQMFLFLRPSVPRAERARMRTCWHGTSRPRGPLDVFAAAARGPADGSGASLEYLLVWSVWLPGSACRLRSLHGSVSRRAGSGVRAETFPTLRVHLLAVDREFRPITAMSTTRSSSQQPQSAGTNGNKAPQSPPPSPLKMSEIKPEFIARSVRKHAGRAKERVSTYSYLSYTCSFVLVLS